MAEEKEFIDGATLTDENVPWYGDMPDVSMALPWTVDIFPDEQHPNGNPEQPNGALWPWRIFIGADDDPNRSRVPRWVMVDDLGGLAQLWAGMYNGTLFLYAGAGAPTAGLDDFSDMTGAPIGGADDVWRTGQPVLPLTPLGIDERDDMLKNSRGQWRRMVWEPVGIFDIAPHKNTHDADGSLNIVRYTLWLVVEYPFLAFYTTKACLDGATQQDGAPARWPFSHYLSAGEEQTEQEVFYVDENSIDIGYGHGFTMAIAADSLYSEFFRLSPLPWQTGEDGELESAEDAVQYDGVQEGQCYTMPPQWPCGRYFGTLTDALIDIKLLEQYQDGGEHYEYRKLSKNEARTAIVDSVQAAATNGWSIDPALLEEMGRSLPDGATTGSAWQTDPPEYEVAFSLHLDEQADRWPHWLAFMVCHAPTALLTASACSWYNDFRPAGGWENEGGDPTNPLPDPDPNDPDDVPPSDDNPGTIWPDNPGVAEDDPPTPDDDGGVIQRPLGAYYESGDGVQVSAAWNAQKAGWDFVVRPKNFSTQTSYDYEAQLFVTIEDDPTTYTYGGVSVSMYYGVKADGSAISVDWASSVSSGLGVGYTHEATAVASGSGSVNVSVNFFETPVTSDEFPSAFCGNVLKAEKVSSFVKRGRFKHYNQITQKYEMLRYERSFNRYNLSLRRNNVSKFAHGYVTTKAPTRTGDMQPQDENGECYIWGSSPGLTGPIVEAVSSSMAIKAQKNSTLYGRVGMSLVASFNAVTTTYNVSGSDHWRDDKLGSVNGSISGTFEVTFQPLVYYYEIPNLNKK